MPTITATPATKKEPMLTQLQKDAKTREAFIDRIKAEVSQETDNINHPVPLFSQLEQLS